MEKVVYVKWMVFVTHWVVMGLLVLNYQPVGAYLLTPNNDELVLIDEGPGRKLKFWLDWKFKIYIQCLLDRLKLISKLIINFTKIIIKNLIINNFLNLISN